MSGSSASWPTRRRRASRSASASSTSTTSSGSTTATATRPATRCSPSPRRTCARAARRSASAATSSRSCCPSTTRTARIAAQSIVERIAPCELAAGRAGHGQRGHRDVPGSGRRPRRARSPRRQRALLGEGARQEPRAQLPARGRRARRAEEARRRRRPGRALPRRGQPREAVDARDAYRGSTPSASPTSRRGSPRGSASTTSRSS